MNEQLMRKVQRSSDSVWALNEGSSTTLRIGPGSRVMQALAGRLWLTSSGSDKDASLDVWLEAGESIELPDGLEVVLEGWPRARFQLLVPPSACRRPPAQASRGAGPGAWLWRQLQGLGMPALPLARH
jgi:hypothetical protein